MEEINPDVPSQPPASGGQDISQPAARSKPPRSRVMWGLLAFHALCALVAVILLWRGRASSAKTMLGSPGKLLSVVRENGVGWVSIHGTIYHSASGRVWERGVEQWSRRINSLADENEVKAIVLDIDSPGGSVGAVQELYDVVRRVREEKHKPVVAVVGDMAASGGYYLASACDKIVAHPGSLLGSIGVIFNTMNVQGLFSKIGVKSDPIKSGKMKDIGSPTRPMTPEEHRLLQGIIDDAYGQFLAAVSHGRRIQENVLRPMADGRIFTGRQAMALGLVDVLGDSQDALKLAARLGGLPANKPPKVIRDADSLEGMIGLLGSQFSGVLQSFALSGPGAGLPGLGAWLPDFSRAGLEYRWTGG